ncbi:MAG: glycosyltransferase family 2 protein [Lentisphaeria bacterium]|nr:glycosyltransferase family 2 protein [Lentisphaeria bacterium]
MKRNKLSIVIPAYNEEARLSSTLQACEELARDPQRFWKQLQIVVVCDGCTDGTRQLAESWCPAGIEPLVVSYPQNRGKGGALRAGMARTQGDVICFIDADGSTSPTELLSLTAPILAGRADVVVGSRRTSDARLPDPQPWYRQLLGSLFARVAATALGLPLKDTQCGCKLFEGGWGRKLFAESRENGFAIDLEILHSACRWGLRLVEKGVCWHHVEGSTVRPLRDGLRMLGTVLSLRLSRSHRLDSSIPARAVKRSIS